MMNDISILIWLPIVAGLVLFLIPGRIANGIISLVITAIFTWFAVELFGASDRLTPLFSGFGNSELMTSIADSLAKFSQLSINPLSRLIILFLAVLAPLINLYSIYTEKNKAFPSNFYAWFLITLGASAGTVLADNLLLFLFFWGVLGYTLFMLISQHDEDSSDAAKKTLIMVGSSDAIMIIGIGLIWNIAGTLNISELSLETNSGAAVTAFILLAVGAFTKAGAFPFHTWIINFSKKAHGISSAFMPASFDKLIGIYFLVLLCSRIFILGDWLTFTLLLIGVMTIIFAVMMALVQHNYKKLLGYHAVSQVGYMVVGIALGSPLGIAAGLFHMFNNAVYKSGLFLTATSVERKTGTAELEKTGGLARAMPVTFATALIFALSISGIPPLNGFASKWMIYQGIIDLGNQGGIASQLWIVWLALAVFGSALTLASFIKFIAGIFLGSRKQIYEHVKEVKVVQWIPMAILAVICIWFGAFATKYIVRELFMPVTGEFSFTGTWDSSLLAWLVLASVVIGVLIYWLGSFKKMRRADSFIGGEKVEEQHDYPVTGFYTTLTTAPVLSTIYSWAEKKYFDLYYLFKWLVLGLNKVFSFFHTGVLNRYAFWIYGGFVILLVLMLL